MSFMLYLKPPNCKVCELIFSFCLDFTNVTFMRASVCGGGGARNLAPETSDKAARTTAAAHAPVDAAITALRETTATQQENPHFSLSICGISRRQFAAILSTSCGFVGISCGIVGR